MTVFDEVQAALDDALVVTAHARPIDESSAIEPGDDFVATFSVENIGISDRQSSQARTAFVGVTLRIEATPFAAPLVDGEPVNDVTLEVGELIVGEVWSHECTLRALAALDGPEPFARAVVQGRLDLERFFAAQGIHRFTTEIRRAPAIDPAIESFRVALLEKVLPDGFRLDAWTFDFDGADDFEDVADDSDRFRNFIRERVAEVAESRGLADEAISAATLPLANAWYDMYESGYQASLALGLWFIGFDQGESISFDGVKALARGYFESFDTYEGRRELRLIKGFENDGVLAGPITVVDLPVVVDYGSRTITLWAGSLRV
ncbi:MAG: hypothetical protein EA397_16300 [Deltaproteobacteria bacterium]|nr:MAG: hypothetical protein EA397_16300 [Deltaproteobacteria bacterium]